MISEEELEEEIKAGSKARLKGDRAKLLPVVRSMVSKGYSLKYIVDALVRKRAIDRGEARATYQSFYRQLNKKEEE